MIEKIIESCFVLKTSCYHLSYKNFFFSIDQWLRLDQFLVKWTCYTFCLYDITIIMFIATVASRKLHRVVHLSDALGALQ